MGLREVQENSPSKYEDPAEIKYTEIIMSHPFSKKQFPQRRYPNKFILVSKEVYDRTPPEVRRTLNMKIYQRERR